MKKLLSLFLSICIVFSLFACGTIKHQAENLKIGLVISNTSIDDKTYNQNAWLGIEKYAKEKNLPVDNYSYTNTLTEDDLKISLADFADQKMNLIIATGYYFSDSIISVSKKYPEQKFFIIDKKLDSNLKLTNLSSAIFAANEGSFLVGIAAALKAQEMDSDKVAFIGGVESVLLKEFELGYIQGVKSVNENIKVDIEYVGDFSNPLKGQEIANTMFENGNSVIFSVAGFTGNGVIDEAVTRNKNGEEVWVIGVDRDQYQDGIYENNKSCILTSMLKRVDIASYEAIKSVENNTFENISTLYSLKNNGVGIPDQNPNLKDEWLKIINDYKQKIINGEIIVDKVE